MHHTVLILTATHLLCVVGGILLGMNNPRIAAATKKVAAAAQAAAKKAVGK